MPKKSNSNSKSNSKCKFYIDGFGNQCSKEVDGYFQDQGYCKFHLKAMTDWWNGKLVKKYAKLVN